MKGFTIAILVFVVIMGFSSAQKNPSLLANNPNKICEPIFPDPNLNLAWLKGVPKWYLTGWDRKFFEKSLALLVGPTKLAMMSENDKVTKSCLTSGSLGGEVDTVSDGLKDELKARPVHNPIRPGVIDWQLNNDYYGTTYILLTDNSSYFLGLEAAADDGSKAVLVGTTGKTISPAAMKDINEKIKELGYAENSLFQPDFSACTN